MAAVSNNATRKWREWYGIINAVTTPANAALMTQRNLGVTMARRNICGRMAYDVAYQTIWRMAY